MKSKSLFVMLVMALIAVLAVPAAFGEDVAEESNTIVDIAVENGSFTTLVAAVQAAGLGEALSTGSWTVFAPNDAAFAKLGLDADNIASTFSKAELTDILLYHAIEGQVDKATAIAYYLGDVVMANGKIAGLKVFESNLYVNDDSKVIAADIFASNGVIHVVDTVILGPWPRTDEGESVEVSEPAPTGDTIVDIAVDNGNFTTLVAAVQAAGLAEALSTGSWTVFAPTDAAFAKLGLNADNIAGAFTKAELTDILLYHALEGQVDAATAIAYYLGDVTMANGKLAGLKVFQGNLYVNDDSKVTTADIFASNGVIHVVDTVILGPWPKEG